jgi:hypothetical protein
MQSIPCDIVLLPNPELAQRAIAFSDQLSLGYGTVSALHVDGPVPHASLYMTQLKVSDMGRVQEILADIAARASVFDLAANGYWLDARYFDADYKKTNALADLQMAVINAINPIRDGLRGKDQAHLLTAEGVARENLKTYGYRGVGELFRPHMTFTRFADEQLAMDVIKKPDAHVFDGAFDRIGLYEMGDNGTCVRRIAEFPLIG